MTSAANIDPFFPTFLLRADFPEWESVNPLLLESAYEMKKVDQAGHEWSEREYGVGYTSYVSGMNILDYPGMKQLGDFIVSQAGEFAQFLDIDFEQISIGMTDLWVNINPTYSYHTDHLHGDSLFSGVYYVQTAPGCGGIQFRDPRPVTAMIRPPHSKKTERNSDTLRIEPRPGLLMMFPAWLMHGVEQNLSDTDRVSISYNFGFRYNDP